MNKELTNAVYKIIQAAPEPIDTEKIAKQVDVGWGTALRCALELLIEKRIQGMKTSKSWVFWMEKEKVSRYQKRETQ